MKCEVKRFVSGDFCHRNGLEPYLSFIVNEKRYLAGILRRLHLSDLVFSRRKPRLLQNLIRCESHRDVCINILEAKLKRENNF